MIVMKVVCTRNVHYACFLRYCTIGYGRFCELSIIQEWWRGRLTETKLVCTTYRGILHIGMLVDVCDASGSMYFD